MKEYQIRNENVSYYVESIGVEAVDEASPEKRKEILEEALQNAEMDISVDWGDNWAPAEWQYLHYDFMSPRIDRPESTSTLTGWLDLRGFERQVSEEAGEDVKFHYIDAWGVEQDKVPLCIRVWVNAPEED